MSDAVKVTRDGDVALIELNEPASRNAFSQDIRDGLRDAAAALTGDATLRAVVLTGTGGVFSAGGDLKAMLRRHKSGEEYSHDTAKARMEALHNWFKQFCALPVPVIAAVDGPAYGAGFGLAMCADIVIASERAEFGASFAKVGAVPDCNLMWSLPRIIGLQKARELFYTARVVGATEAQALGICMEVLPPEAVLPRALEIAGMMQETSQLAFSLTKELTGRALQSDAETMLKLEAEAQAQCLTSEYHINAIGRFTEKKPPKFNFS
ncbi:enoyl-CoA hydratase/isomerase family protein [Ascidiaceihabitans sp.]|uniref:enoyl-CoA hydratase/isomerase family protein n=1 Tax=Ascidiaceihabitans sp. TaxID=1872644 RepID=UPI003297E006